MPTRPISSALRAASMAVGLVAVTAMSGCGGNGDSGPEIPVPEATTVDEILGLGRPVVLAHASGENAHPHSSPYGYALSVAAGVDILDLDVRLTSDEVLVIHHDDDVDRTTEGTGLVADMTFEELHALDNAYWWTEECTCDDQPEDAYVWRGVRTGDKPAPDGFAPEDFAVARFSDIAAEYPNHMLNIEVKGEAPEALRTAEVLIEELRELDAIERSVVTSFDDEIVTAIAEMEPALELTPGLDTTSAWVLAGAPLPDGMRILQVPPEYEGITVLTEDLVRRAHEAGYVLWIWPNAREWENADGYGRLLDFGVDGINAAEPPTAVEVLRTRGIID